MDAADSCSPRRQQTVKALAELSWSTDRVARFMASPNPKEYPLKVRTKLARRALDQLFELWKQTIIAGEPGHEDAQRVLLEIATQAGLNLADTRILFLMALVEHFDCLLRPFLAAEKVNDVGLPASLIVNAYREKMASEDMYKEEPNDFQPLRHLSFGYLATVSSICIVQFVYAAGHPSVTYPFAAFAFKGLESFIGTASRYPANQFKALPQILLRSVAALASQVHAFDVTAAVDRKVGPFSSIRLDELAGLAKRSPGVLKRYGAKAVERVFEQQLALVIQSFGFVVISTRIGHGTVDLVCISADPAEPFTFVIEAKSTHKNYALPTKDSRALRDYVSDIRRTLTTLPPLGFVLIVSHASAKTLDGKIAALEGHVGVPVRFLKAGALAELRELIVGPFPLRMFRESVVAGERILHPELPAVLAKKASMEKQAYQQFAESMFVARGVTRPRPPDKLH